MQPAITYFYTDNSSKLAKKSITPKFDAWHRGERKGGRAHQSTANLLIKIPEISLLLNCDQVDEKHPLVSFTPTAIVLTNCSLYFTEKRIISGSDSAIERSTITSVKI